MITFKDVKDNEAIKTYIKHADMTLSELGYTEHSLAHVSKVASVAKYILETLNYSEREIELAQIACYLHDIGNAVNRVDHAHSGAILAYNILTKMGMSYAEAAEIMLAIGNHDENTGAAVSNISAALVIADKSDVHRTRVRNNDIITFDIHDRVNYAVESSNVFIDREKNLVVLELCIDTKICPVMDYFEIFLVRMAMNRRAAEFLGLKFQLIINGTYLL